MEKGGQPVHLAALPRNMGGAQKYWTDHGPDTKCTDGSDRRKPGLWALEQSGDLAVLVHVDALGGRDLRKTGHGHDVAGEGHQEAGAGRDLQVAHGDGKALGRAQKGGVIGEGLLGLGHARSS